MREIGSRRRAAQRQTGRGRREARPTEADHDSRPGVGRQRCGGHQLVQRLLLRDRQQPLGREHRGSGHGGEAAPSCRQAGSSTSGRWSATCTMRPAPGRATRSRAGRSPSRARSAAASPPRFHDAVQRGVPGRHGAAGAEEPQRVHRPVSARPRCHRGIVGDTKQTMSFTTTPSCPILITRDRQERRQPAMAHLQDLERAERPDRQGHQHGYPAGHARRRHRREGWIQASRLRVPQQLPGERRQGWTTVSIYATASSRWRRTRSGCSPTTPRSTAASSSGTRR